MTLAALIQKGVLRELATATPATPATDTANRSPPVATVAAVAVAKAAGTAANDPAQDPDRWAWPHSAAMTGAEIDAFTARLARFTDKGVNLDDGGALADKLVKRDRESDDRRLCLECLHLAGFGAWRCGNWQRAGAAIRARDAQLPGELVYLLQRCEGFTDTKSHP